MINFVVVYSQRLETSGFSRFKVWILLQVRGKQSTNKINEGSTTTIKKDILRSCDMIFYISIIEIRYGPTDNHCTKHEIFHCGFLQ